MSRSLIAWLLMVLACPISLHAGDTKPARKYFAHPVVEDRDGVIAPWYRGQNGQCDFRVRIAAEALKRYPWADKDIAVVPAPHYLFNGHWAIKPDGTISVNQKLGNWDNGDVGQRSLALLLGFADYYRYTGDPAAIGIITMTADYILDYCQTPADHSWPNFFISAPTKGKAYGRANPHGFIQLDLTAWAGLGMVNAFKVTGDPRYWEAAKHWTDVLAEHCSPHTGSSPWPRFANPEDTPWQKNPQNNRQTAGVVFILQFLDVVTRSGYSGKANALVKAREAGEKYVRDTLLPEWNRDPTFGHHFWDWVNPVMTCTVPSQTCRYLMDHRESFPGWEADVRNILSLPFARLSVNPGSSGDVYSGAWAMPESSSCCGKSLQYPILPIAAGLAQYAHLTNNAWAKEIARRQTILFTYDIHETGVVEDGIDGGTPVTGIWFNLAHPWPLRGVMELLAWQPETAGANRENHIMRTTSIVRTVRYDKGQVAYETFDAPAGTEDVLRLAFTPNSVSADGKPLALRQSLTENGYAVKPLGNGDCIVTVRHDGFRKIVVTGDDPQESAEDDRLQYEGTWTTLDASEASGGKLHVAESAGAAVSLEFQGNQVRLVGRADPNGGKADVYLDGVKQLCGIDFWCPQTRDRQILCYRNGLAQGKHTLKIVASGTKNPRSGGARVYVDAMQWSAAQGEVPVEAGGPSGSQRVIFGYTGRKDYVDSEGHPWRPATEFIMRLKAGADLVPISFWTDPRLRDVAGTKDPELYRYGVHGQDFTAYFTVHPRNTYYARVKLCQATAPAKPGGLATTIDLQGKTVATDLDIAAAAGGLGKAFDLVYNGIRPEHGVIAIRFRHRSSGQAMVQAIEIGPGQAAGAKP